MERCSSALLPGRSASEARGLTSVGLWLLIFTLGTLFPLAAAFALCTVRIVGVHVNCLQPAARWLHAELFATLAAMLLFFCGTLAWCVTCYHTSTEWSVDVDLTPTGLVWLVVCCVFLLFSIGLLLLIRSDPAPLRFGSPYTAELSNRSESIASQGYRADEVHMTDEDTQNKAARIAEADQL